MADLVHDSKIRSQAWNSRFEKRGGSSVVVSCLCGAHIAISFNELYKLFLISWHFRRCL